MMDKKQLQAQLKAAAENGTLMTPKHDPRPLLSPSPPVYSSFRTVLSHETAASLISFIDSGNYEVNLYQNNNPRHPDDYYEIIPTTTEFSVPASGIAAHSPIPTSLCDRLIAASGLVQSWHLFGEESSNIQARMKSGDLVFVKTLE